MRRFSMPALVSGLLGVCLLCWGQAVLAVKELPAPSPFHVFEVDARAEKLRLAWRDPDGHLLGSFERWKQDPSLSGVQLVFAMNAGMFQSDSQHTPMGLLVVDGKIVHRINRRVGPKTNFYQQPNGVFFVDAAGPHIVRTQDYPVRAAGVRLATQSGPMLVNHGMVNRILDRFTRLATRNGVGVRGRHVYFVITDRSVTFSQFAKFFAQTLHCDAALFLDGNISGAIAPNQRQIGASFDFGPMIGVVR